MPGFLERLVTSSIVVGGLLVGAVVVELTASSCASAPAAAQSSASPQEAELCIGEGCGQPWCAQRGVVTPQLFICPGGTEDAALEFKKAAALDTHWLVASPDDAGGDDDDDLTFSTDTTADVLVLGAGGIVTVGDVLALTPRATAPTPIDGMVYYDSTGSDAVCARVNGSWVVLGGAGSCA